MSSKSINDSEVENKKLELSFQIIDNTEEEVVDFRYGITSYGADYPVDAVVKRVANKSFFVPKFQRQYVWTLPQASRFIESLILGLPVPGIFLAKENDSSKHLIIDGQQRILTLSKFYAEQFDEQRPFALEGVQKDLEGKTYRDLSMSDQMRLDDALLHATIVCQDTSSDDNSSIYIIFERLNTGGVSLESQEIRAGIYHGDFSNFLSKCVENENWRLVFGKANQRMKEQELILRFFALYCDIEAYKAPLKLFLNTFMQKNRNFEAHSKADLTNLFENTIAFIAKTLGKKAFRPEKSLNAAVFDAVMIGTASFLEKNKQEIDAEKYHLAYKELLENVDFKTYVSSSTSTLNVVKGRIELAMDAFNELTTV